MEELYKKANYIVTGATGYVGNMIVKRLLNDGCQVVGLIRSVEKANRVFKEQTGANLLAYIQAVRINMAKKLLKNSNHTIEQISIETGFSNSDSFRRVFKKTEGITPGDYKKLN